MDFVTLKKKLSSYTSAKGYLLNVSDEVLYEVLIAWENWTGPSKDFYRSLGFSHRQMASVIGKAKKLKREGYFGEGDFKQIKIDSSAALPASVSGSGAVEIVWNDGRIIRFAGVDLAVDFLKKA